MTIALQVVEIVVGIVVLYGLICIRILNEYERGVIFRLGRVLATPKGPGLMLVFWPIDRMVRVSLRTYVQDVPSQDVITHDNVSVKALKGRLPSFYLKQVLQTLLRDIEGIKLIDNQVDVISSTGLSSSGGNNELMARSQA